MVGQPALRDGHVGPAHSRFGARHDLARRADVIDAGARRRVTPDRIAVSARECDKSGSLEGSLESTSIRTGSVIARLDQILIEIPEHEKLVVREFTAQSYPVIALRRQRLTEGDSAGAREAAPRAT